MSAVGLDVVIVAFGRPELIGRCLASLRAFPPTVPVGVVVVDNGTEDGGTAVPANGLADVELIRPGRNLGFAAATNLGVRRGSAPYVLALNPDTELRAGTLDRLLDLLRERPEVGVAGCRLERADGTFDHASKRSFPTILGALGHFARVGRRSGGRRLAQYRAPDVESGPVDAVNGAFMLMRRAALQEVGGFDEGYWMYMEDLDLCRRMHAAGWVTWYQPDVTALHLKGATSDRRRSARLVYAFHYGMYRFYRLHEAPARAALVNALVYAGIGCKLLGSLSRTWVRPMPRP
jgi:N-acetylglucosaminyl-diphospho-decaprenol L-rhamnosyltransferase